MTIVPSAIQPPHSNFPDSTNRKTLRSSFLSLALAVASLLLWVTPETSAQTVPFVNPPNIDYRGGVVELRAALANITWAGQPARSNVYSARYGSTSFAPSFAPPTIRTHPDAFRELRLRLTNNIDFAHLGSACLEGHEFTNLHYHGFEVSPVQPSDDVVNIKIHEGKSFDYVVPFPQITGKEHPEGMFWYHPHPHGCSFAQVSNGMSGALIVGDILRTRYPAFVGIKENILLLKDSQPDLTAAATMERALRSFFANPKAKAEDRFNPPATVNALHEPTITIRPGEFQFFRIGNVGSDAYFNIALPNVEAFIIAVDGFPTQGPIPLDSSKGWLLPPGSRVEMLVRGPQNPGPFVMTSLDAPETAFRFVGTLMHLQVAATKALKEDAKSGARLAALQQAPATPAKYYPLPSDFAQAKAAELQCQILTPSNDPRGNFVFTQDANGNFFMNGLQYREDVLNVTCPIPSHPTWTIYNNTDINHTFHIHQIHFRVNKIGDHIVTDNEAPFRDNVDVPPHTGVELTLPFDETYLAGKFVLHCHILFHEDHGMMMNIELHLLTAQN